jgi:hypothetical protein
MTTAIATAAYDVCEKFNSICAQVETQRNADWGKKKVTERVAYYAFQAFTYIGTIAAVGCLVMAAVNLSLGYLGCAAIAAVAAGAFGILSLRFGTFGFNEGIHFNNFKNPLGLVKNKESVPPAGALREASGYFDSLVPAVTTAPKDDKEKAKQEKDKKAQEAALAEAEKFFVNQNLFDKTYTGKDLSERVVNLSSTLAVTGYTLAAIQDVFAKNAPKKELLEKANSLVGKSIYNDAAKESFKLLIAHLIAQSKDFQEAVQQKVSTVSGKPVYKLADLDTLAEAAKKLPAPAAPVPAPVKS